MQGWEKTGEHVGPRAPPTCLSSVSPRARVAILRGFSVSPSFSRRLLTLTSLSSLDADKIKLTAWRRGGVWPAGRHPTAVHLQRQQVVRVKSFRWSHPRPSSACPPRTSHYCDSCRPQNLISGPSPAGAASAKSAKKGAAPTGRAFSLRQYSVCSLRVSLGAKRQRSAKVCGEQAGGHRDWPDSRLTR